MLHLLRIDLKRSIDIKRTVLTALAAVIALFFFVQFFSEDMTEDRLLEKLHIGIIDQERSELSKMLIQSFHNNDKFTSLVEITEGNKAEVLAEYETGKLTAVITIPESFTTSLLHYENEPLDVILNPEHPLRSTVLNEMLSSYSDYIKAVDASTYGLYRTLKEADFPAEDLKQTNDFYSVEMISTALGRNRLFTYKAIDTFPATTSGVYFGSAIIVMIAAFSASGILPLVFEDLRLNCTQRYMTVSHQLTLWILSKLISMSLNATILSFFVALPLIFVFQMDIIQSLILLIQILIISVFFGSLALLIGVVTGNESSATVTTNLVYFILGLAGGNFIPIPLMPKSIQDISAWTPNYWAIKGLLNNMANLKYGLGLIDGLFLVSSICIVLLCAWRLERSLQQGGVIYE